MIKISPIIINSGSSQLDGLLQGLRPGDNVVWQIDHLDDYSHFAELFAVQTVCGAARTPEMPLEAQNRKTWIERVPIYDHTRPLTSRRRLHQRRHRPR